MLTEKPSPGEAATSMIQELLPQLQSITILHVSLKSTNLKTMTHYFGVMERLIQILKPSAGDQAPSTILEKILKLQLMLVDQPLLRITNLKSMIHCGAMLIGTVEGSTIYWGPSQQYDNGISPSIAISTSGLVVIEYHQSQNDETLWHHVGRVDGHNITWGSSHKYDSGTSPSIAINDNFTTVEVQETRSSALAYRVGTVQQ